MEGKTKLAFSNRLISEAFSGKNYVCVEIKFIIYMRFYVIRIRPLVRTDHNSNFIQYPYTRISLKRWAQLAYKLIKNSPLPPKNSPFPPKNSKKMLKNKHA